MFKSVAITLLFVAFSTASQSVSAQTLKLEQALSYSDDLARHSDAFVSASLKLIEGRSCTISDFHAAGGWSKATGTNQTRPIYFTYCGGFSIVNRWYVNIESGRIYQ